MYDKFWNRVIFLIMDVNNRVIGFGGQSHGRWQAQVPEFTGDEDLDKSRNSLRAECGQDHQEELSDPVSGYMDVIAMHQAALPMQASLELHLTSGHASLVKRYTKEVLLFYDSDGCRDPALRAIPISGWEGWSHVQGSKPEALEGSSDEFIKNEGGGLEERLNPGHGQLYVFVYILRNRNLPWMQLPGQNQFF